MQITHKSPRTGRYNTRDVPVTLAQMAAWQGGRPAQDVFGHLSSEDREFLISGYTPEDWQALFGPGLKRLRRPKP